MANMIRWIGAGTLLMAGCTSSTDSIANPSGTAELEKVTFYVAGMNQRLKIL